MNPLVRVTHSSITHFSLSLDPLVGILLQNNPCNLAAYFQVNEIRGSTFSIALLCGKSDPPSLSGIAANGGDLARRPMISSAERRS